MRVLVVGGGGREHALCWRLAQSPAVDRILAAPGNAGMAEVATVAPVAVTDVPGLVDLAERESVDLTVVGPEAPLVVGLVDELQARGMAVFGPTQDAARIEGSKVWARSLCERHGVPAPRSRVFEEVEPAMEYLVQTEPPYVIKADGLAAGKGVAIAEDRPAAQKALEDCLIHRIFGDAGRSVLVEEYLEGSEVTAMAVTDGRTILPLALAQDFKRAYEGDTGPNTGGMGAYSPVPMARPEVESRIVNDILQATADALAAEGVQYQGVLYAGVMLTFEGPKVLEFNCRFGDPEAQVVLPRLVGNFPELLLACVERNLAHYELAWTPQACVGVVLASQGYPGPVDTGRPISGLEDVAGQEGVQVFHAGTVARDGKVVTSGGRVLTVTALGSDVSEARRRAYEACSLIHFDGMHYRKDIAERATEGTG
ncbi:MAG TPA: phosphoribosylamine--glycine ligase [Actinomycetota bacterium]